MRLIVIFLSVGLLGACSSNSSDLFRSTFDPRYEVADKGGLDATVRGRACALDPQEARRAAENTAAFHLRSVVGNERYLPRFKEIGRSSSGGQTCVEVLATPQVP